MIHLASMLRSSLFILSIILLSACSNPKSTSQEEESDFLHEVETDSKPWTQENFDSDKFSFAIFGDLTGGERERIFEVAVAQMNLLRPDFIINVGDLIEGDHESIEELNGQWNDFDKRAQKAKAPLFYIGGNHDLTTAEMLHIWEERYGRSYYHFVYKNTLFLILDTEDNAPERSAEIAEIRERAIAQVKEKGWDVFPETEYANIPEQKGGNISSAQSEYFKSAIADNPNVLHTFIFVHKAPWKIEDPEFLEIEDALKDREFTLYNGHVHTYENEIRNGHDYIRLATTGGVQFPEKGLSLDHFLWVTVDENGVTIANLKLEGILDKTGHIPLGGDTLMFEKKENDE